MSKITRDAAAFAARVKMGSKRIWVIVEGRVHDLAFYDGVVGAQVGAAEHYSVRLAETIEVDGVAAGGKDHALALFRWLEDHGSLKQTSNHGSAVIAFALDRDFDHLLDKIVQSEHVMYTRSADVESEILLNADIHRAASYAYSLTTETTKSVLPDTTTLAQQLATLWREWIGLGIAAAACDVTTDMRFASRSKINDGGYGALDAEKADALRDSITMRLTEDLQERFDELQQVVQDHYDRGEAWSLVKGKWITSYVWHLIGATLQEQPHEQQVRTETLAKTAMASLDFNEPWTQDYRQQIGRLLAA